MNGTSQIQCLQSIIIKRNIFYATICFKYSALGVEFLIVVNKYWHIILSDSKLQAFLKMVRNWFSNAKTIFVTCLSNLNSLHVKNKAFQLFLWVITDVAIASSMPLRTSAIPFSHPCTGCNISIHGTITCAPTHVISHSLSLWSCIRW